MRHELVALVLVACADDGGPRHGESCGSDAECESGLCFEGACLDASGDLDGDGLSNASERGDSDHDGIPDYAEAAVVRPFQVLFWPTIPLGPCGIHDGDQIRS